MISKLSIITLLGMLMLSAPASALPDLSVGAIDAYHTGDFGTYASPWINLSNEVDVTINNTGDGAGAFNVSLYANDVFIDKLPVSSLGAVSSTTVKFNWVPDGCDCDEGCTPVTYTVKAIADCDGEVGESNEDNNESSTTETAIWNGYAADEPLENLVSGRLNGGLIYTTGTGKYGSLSAGYSRTASYTITLPPDAEVELARLNVYYTWVYPLQSRPVMEVSITNQTGTHILTADRYYDDRKGWGAFDMFWGNWAYDVTPYIRESGTYEVTVKNNATTGSVCPAGPGIVILYSDETKPTIDYWINEGGDVLEVKNGYLRRSEAITNASFDGQVHGKVVNASLGLVNPWANSLPDGSEVFFNGLSLGQDVYCGGYGHSLYCSRSMSAIDMETNVGDADAQVAISLLDVKERLNVSGNYAGMGDIADSGALPANAFLLVEYEPEAAEPFMVSGWVNDSSGNPMNDPDVAVANMNTAEEFVVQTAAGSNYYQVMTDSSSVSAGDVLSFSVSGGTPVSHAVTQAEMDAGGFEQNLTVEQTYTCGDVDGQNGVTIGDGIQVAMSVIYGTEEYPLAYPGAADVDCQNGITIGDGIQISMSVIYGIEEYPLQCCSG